MVFKQPAFDYRPVPHGGAHITFPAAPYLNNAAPYEQEYAQLMTYPHVQPRPVEQYTPTYQNSEQRQVAGEPYAPTYTETPLGPTGTRPYHPNYSIHVTINHQPNVVAAAASYQNHHGHIPATSNALPYAVPADYAPAHSYPLMSGVSPIQNQHDWQQPYQIKQEHHLPQTSPTASANADRVSPTSSMSSRTMPLSQNAAPENSFSVWTPGMDTARQELTRSIDYQPQPVATPFTPQQMGTTTAPLMQPLKQETSPELHEHETYVQPATSPTNFLSQAAVEIQDDDYYDVDSDEEMDVGTLAVTTLTQGRQSKLHRILNKNKINIEALQSRRNDAFVYDGILDHYRVEDAANPLRNPATVRVFAHFIYVTGPGLSVFERHGRNTSVLFSQGQVPFSKQGLWTYAMPVAALRHQGLLHAMLALSSLHISRLQRASDTPSRQHYIWACKRINRLLTDPTKRYKITTIATSMLLGFYEVMTADHRQWNMHLSGSKQLFAETDFASLTRQFRQMKSARAARWHLGREDVFTSPNLDPQDDILDQIDDVDERVISRLVGRAVRYDDHGWITPQSGLPPQLNLSNFGLLKDLYWWYIKQDAFQSIISGNPPL